MTLRVFPAPEAAAQDWRHWAGPVLGLAFSIALSIGAYGTWAWDGAIVLEVDRPVVKAASPEYR